MKDIQLISVPFSKVTVGNKFFAVVFWIYLLLFYVFACLYIGTHVCTYIRMYVCICTCMLSAQGGQKRALDPLELEQQLAVGHHVDDGNLIWVPQSRECLSARSQLMDPLLFGKPFGSHRDIHVQTRTVRKYMLGPVVYFFPVNHSSWRPFSW